MLSKSQVKYIQSLGHKKFRDESNCFVAEGPKMALELIQSGFANLVHLYAVGEWMESNTSVLAGWSPQLLTEVSSRELESISFLNTPNQVLAIFNKPVFHNIVAEKAVSLLLDNIQDPGNMGSLVRIADWFGISQIVCDLQTADVYNPKVVQATMGSICRVPVIYSALDEFMEAHTHLPLFATVLDGADLRLQTKIDEGMVLIGNESRGISSSLMRNNKNLRKITIPGKGGAESLNAAVAAGIVLSHLLP